MQHRLAPRFSIVELAYIGTLAVALAIIVAVIAWHGIVQHVPSPRTVEANVVQVNPAIRHYYQNYPGVKRACRLPVAPARFTHGTVRQRFQRCTISGRYSMRLNATPTPRPTVRPSATVAPIPFPTSPAPTLMPLPTAAPTPSPTPDCWSDYDRCLLSRINGVRAQHGYAALTLSAQQTPRSQNHADAMEATGSIWHVNSSYPADSFPQTIYCYPNCAAGENVGEASGSEAVAIQADLDQMLSEPWSPGCVGNHACSLLSPEYHQIGIGISYTGSVVYVAEDFLG